MDTPEFDHRLVQFQRNQLATVERVTNNEQRKRPVVRAPSTNGKAAGASGRFFVRNTGSLGITINPADLRTTNSALNVFFVAARNWAAEREGGQGEIAEVTFLALRFGTIDFKVIGPFVGPKSFVTSGVDLIARRIAGGPMPHVVTDNCTACRFTDCVSHCPVECFHADAERLYIDPEVCIDCGACIDACPVHAIYDVIDMPDDKVIWIKINAEQCALTPVIRSQQEPLATAHARRAELGF